MTSAWHAIKSGLMDALGSNKDEVDDKVYQAAKTRDDLIPGNRTKEFMDWLLPLLEKHQSCGGYVLDVGTANGFVKFYIVSMFIVRFGQ